MRMVGGTLIGLIGALVLVTGIRLLALTQHPLADMAVNDPQAMNAWIAGAPIALVALYAAAWPLGALAGGVLASYISRSHVPAWIVAAIAVLLSASAMLTLTFPVWAQVVLVAGPLVAGWLATRLVPAGAADPTDG
ncbi:hypothetical protein [Sphingomonas soli]|uniref:hypothetical protein n=1 Tax=Sphingomonas soli TaxID=266127 RepID=UPI000AD86007|nr:hypothetical protein [Sphingomonas soli]